MRRYLLAFLAASLLCSCGANNPYGPSGGCTPPAIAAQLVGKVWIGEFDCGATKRHMRLQFYQSGCNLYADAQILLYNGTNRDSFPAVPDPNLAVVNPLAVFPVQVNGNSATVQIGLAVNNSTNNRTIVPPGPVLVVPGTTVNVTLGFTVTEGSLTGTYTLADFNAPPANRSGNICFSPETVATADVSGHWTGTMTGTDTESVGPGTLDIHLGQDGNAVSSSGPGTFTDSEVTVQINSPTGITGMVIGNQFLFGITFVRSNVTPGAVQHRWFLGTVNGNTITGEYADVVNPSGTGTFTLTRVGTPKSRK